MDKNRSQWNFTFLSAITAALALTAGALVAPTQQVWAASAVAYDGNQSVYGYCYGLRTKKEAINCARQRCYKRRGQNCRIIASCRGRGYGAIYMRRLPGRPIEAIGASCGYAKASDANRSASIGCNQYARSGRCGGPKRGWQD